MNGVPALLDFRDLAAFWGVPEGAPKRIAVENGLGSGPINPLEAALAA